MRIMMEVDMLQKIEDYNTGDGDDVNIDDNGNNDDD